ncbi:hypothetical protein [Pseudoxanthomonas sp. Root65]|uniref:hypothetical protein n=1 Tax=Pseudoxanthomonas sp. Root65 TaxID=1736576 RepID=UPI0012E38490|nr:hypothetical protein [Pseudoxanthomonas sp. Root65]
MTLCIAWKQDNAIHLAADSRLTIATNSYADVGIKVLALPYRILQPAHPDPSRARNVAYQGRLGMCFAGSAVNSLMIKESVAAVLQDLQYAPGYTDVSLKGICEFIFKAYKLISIEICKTAAGPKGIASFIVCGQCPSTSLLRAFKFSTNSNNVHSLDEVLVSSNHEFLGSGAAHVDPKAALVRNRDYLSVLRDMIDDESIESVGGNIQYGTLHNNDFTVYGIIEFKDGVHHWRGALDMNSDYFMSAQSDLISGISYIDPFNTFGRSSAV